METWEALSNEISTTTLTVGFQIVFSYQFKKLKQVETLVYETKQKIVRILVSHSVFT